MNTEIKKALDDEILDDIQRLGDVDVGTEEFKTNAEVLVKLIDRSIEIDKLEAERVEKEKARNLEYEWKNKQLTEQIKARENDAEIRNNQLDEQKLSRESDNFYKSTQLEEERKSRFITNCITVGGIILNVTLTIWGTLKTLEFEKTGTVTSIAGRSFTGKLFKR